MEESVAGTQRRNAARFDVEDTPERDSTMYRSIRDASLESGMPSTWSVGTMATSAKPSVANNEIIHKLEEMGRLRGRFAGRKKEGITITAQTTAAEIFNKKMKNAIVEEQRDMADVAYMAKWQDGLLPDTPDQSFSHERGSAAVPFDMKAAVKVLVKRDMLVYQHDPKALEQMRQEEKAARCRAGRADPAVKSPQAPFSSQNYEAYSQAVPLEIPDLEPRYEDMLLPLESSMESCAEEFLQAPTPKRKIVDHLGQHHVLVEASSPGSNGLSSIEHSKLSIMPLSPARSDGRSKSPNPRQVLSSLVAERSRRSPSVSPTRVRGGGMSLPGSPDSRYRSPERNKLVEAVANVDARLGSAPSPDITRHLSPPVYPVSKIAKVKGTRKQMTQSSGSPGLYGHLGAMPQSMADKRSEHWTAKAKATEIPALAVKQYDPQAEFLDSVAAAAVYEDPSEGLPSANLTHSVERLHRLHLATAEARAPPESPSKEKGKSGKGGKKGQAEAAMATLPPVLQHSHSGAMKVTKTVDGTEITFKPAPSNIRAGVTTYGPVLETEEALKFLSVHDPTWEYSVVRSKYPLGDHTQVYQPNGNGDVYIPLPGLEKESEPEWMKAEALAVPKFREIRKKINDKAASLTKYIRDGSLLLPYSGVMGISAQLLAGTLESMQSLHTLDLTGNKLGDEGVAYLVESLVSPHAPSVEVLQLSECSLGWRSGHSLARLFLANTVQTRKLTNVMLDGNRAFGDRGMAAVATALAENCCHLKLLDVSHCGLTDNGAVSLGHLIEYNGTLTGLWAAHNRFSGEAGTTALMEGLRANDVLLELDLLGCALHGDGMARVAEGVACGGTLKFLDVSGNNISGAGGPAIGYMLQCAHSISNLYCRDNPLTFQGAQELVQGYLDRGWLVEMDLANCAFIKMPEPAAVEGEPGGEETETGSDSPGAKGSGNSGVKLPKLTGQADLAKPPPGKAQSMIPKLPLGSPARVKQMAEKLGILQQASPRFRTRSTMRELAENTANKYSAPLRRSVAAGSLDLRPVRMRHAGRFSSSTGNSEASRPLLAPEPSGQSAYSSLTSDPSHKSVVAEQSSTTKLDTAVAIRFDGAHAAVRGDTDETPRSAFGGEVEDNAAYVAKLSSQRISMATEISKRQEKQRDNAFIRMMDLGFGLDSQGKKPKTAKSKGKDSKGGSQKKIGWSTIVLFGKLKLLDRDQKMKSTASWDSLAITDHQFKDLWLTYDPEKASTHWLMGWLEVLCTKCFFTLPQIAEVLRTFEQSMTHQIDAAAKLIPRQIDSYNLHLLRSAVHPSLWQECLRQMGLPAWMIHATGTTGSYALNMEVAAERNYAQMLLAMQSNRMYDISIQTRSFRQWDTGSDEDLLASKPPPLNMNIQNVSWVIPESSRNGYNEEDFSSLFPPQPGSDLTYDQNSWWNNLWKVGWDASRAVGIPELPRHGWLLMDFAAFPRYNVTNQIGWGYEHQHKRKSGEEPPPMIKTMLDNDPDPDDEPVMEEPRAGAPLLSAQTVMKGVPLYVEPIQSCTKEPRVVQDFMARHLVDERLSVLLGQVESCGLESGPGALETCSIQMLGWEGEEQRILDSLDNQAKDWKKAKKEAAKAEAEAAKSKPANNEEQPSEEEKAMEEAMARMDNIERSVDYIRWGLLTSFPPHMAGRCALETLLLELEEHVAVLSTFDGLCPDPEQFRIHQRHLTPPIELDDYDYEPDPIRSTLDFVRPPPSRTQLLQLPKVVKELRRDAELRANAAISSSSMDRLVSMEKVIAGTDIVELNSPMTVIYWIEWGWVEIEAAVVTAKNTTAAWEAGPGEFIGAVSAATGEETWSFSARALTDVRMWSIPVNSVTELLEKASPGLPETLRAGLARRQAGQAHSAKLLCKGIEIRGPKLKSAVTKPKKGAKVIPAFQFVGFDEISNETPLDAKSDLNASFRTLAKRDKLKLPKFDLPDSAALGPGTSHVPMPSARLGAWRTSTKRRGWWRFQLLMDILEKVRDFGKSSHAGCAALRKVMDAIAFWKTQEKMAFLAALFDCISDIPAMPDLVQPYLTTSEYMLLACRLGWLPLCPINRMEVCPRYNLRLWLPQEFIVAHRIVKAAIQVKSLQENACLKNIRVNHQPLDASIDRKLWKILTYGYVGAKPSEYAKKQPFRGPSRNYSVGRLPVNDRPNELSSNVVEFTFEPEQMEHTMLLISVVAIQAKWRQYAARKRYLRVLAGDITSQNVMLRCLRRVLQGKIDILLGKIKEIEDAEQAKKNRMMSRKGAEKAAARAPEVQQEVDETEMHIKIQRKRIARINDKLKGVIRRKVLMRLKHWRVFFPGEKS